MLIFHGGLPRSGKSYEAVVKHLIPSLKRGRKVYARIDGLNVEKLAALAEISVDRVNELLVQLSEEDAQQIEEREYDVGSLILIDEVQNYWPDARQALNPKITKFVAEHGHHGLDILLMGQEFKDMHKLWQNRVSQLVEFRKLDMVGKGDSYRWTLSKAVKSRKFLQVSSGTEKYEEKYFGSYKSFEPGAEGTQLYEDKRASIWNSAFFKKWAPIALVVGGVAVYYLYDLLGNGKLAENFGGKPETVTAAPATPAVHTAPASRPTVQTADAPEETKKKHEKDFIEDLSERYRLRLTAVVKNANAMTAMFEWYDDGLRVRERLSMVAVARLGYAVVIDDDMSMATISKGPVTYRATQFPLEQFAMVSDERQRQIKGDNSPGGTAMPHSGARDFVDNRDKASPMDGYGVLGKVGPGVRQPGQS